MKKLLILCLTVLMLGMVGMVGMVGSVSATPYINKCVKNGGNSL